MSDIFVCYSHRDRAFAEKLVERLLDRGWSVFIDRQLHVGERWDKTIEHELASARAIVALWSASSRQSEFVLEEAEFGRRKGNLFPVLIEPVEIPYGFGRIEAADLSGWDSAARHDGLDLLLDSLQRVLQPSGTETVKGGAELHRAPPRLLPAQTRPLRRGLLAGIVVALGLAAGVTLLRQGQPAPRPADSPPPSAKADTAPPMLQAGARFRDCGDAACPWLVTVPAGRFAMGSPEDETGRSSDESPAHVVAIAQPFAVMETEVTRRQFALFVQESGYQPAAGCFEWHDGVWNPVPGGGWLDPGFTQTDDHPAVCVDWHAAHAFAGWMSRRTGHIYRLPSEAEWEYAARGGATGRFASWAKEAEPCTLAHIACTGNNPPRGTRPVRQLLPNEFSLYDTHGNAWEWVQDCWHTDYLGAPGDARPWETACAEDRRVMRGGGWGSTPDVVRLANRGREYADMRFTSGGFRLVRQLAP